MVDIPKGKICFTVVLAEGYDKGSYDHLEEIAISLEDMEKFLDSVPPTRHTQEIKRKIWGMFP